jgi:hypothetical protein
MVKTFREWLKMKEAMDPNAQNQVIGAAVGSTQTGNNPNVADIADKTIKNDPRLAAAIGQNPAFDKLMALVNKNAKKINPATQNTSALVPANAAAALTPGPGGV